MKKLILTILGFVIEIMYWTRQIICLPVNLLIRILTKIYLRLYSTMLDSSSLRQDELIQYYEKVLEQYSKCKECETVEDISKFKKDPVIENNEMKEEIVRCSICNSICVFNCDSRIYSCPKCS